MGSRREVCYWTCWANGKGKKSIFLLYTLKEVLKRKNDSVLILVGDGAEKKRLKEIAYELKIEDKVFLQEIEVMFQI